MGESVEGGEERVEAGEAYYWWFQDTGTDNFKPVDACRYATEL
jgi:hypothetical protein